MSTRRQPSPISRAPGPTTPSPAVRETQTYNEAEKIRDSLKRWLHRGKSIGHRFPEKHYGFHADGARKLPFGAIVLYTRPNVAGVAYTVTGWFARGPEGNQLAQNFSREVQALGVLRFPRRVYVGAQRAVRTKMPTQPRSRFLRKQARVAASVIHKVLKDGACTAAAAAASDKGQPEGHGVTAAITLCTDAAAATLEEQQAHGVTAVARTTDTDEHGQFEGHGGTPVPPEEQPLLEDEEVLPTASAGNEGQPNSPIGVAVDEHLPFCNNCLKGVGWKTWAVGLDGCCSCGNTCEAGRKLIPNYPTSMPFVDFRGNNFAGTSAMYVAVINVACGCSTAFKASYDM